MRITVVHPDDLGPSELARWRQFQRADEALDNPFLSAEFTCAVGRVLSRARVAVIEDDAAGIVGFFPFERRNLGVGQPIGAELMGAQGIVHVPGLELDWQELLHACQLSVWEFTDLLPTQTLLDGYQVARAPCPVIDLSRGFDDWVDERRPHYKKLVKDLEGKARRMARDLGEVRFTYQVAGQPVDHVAAEPSGTAALRTLMGWKSAQYRRTGRSDRFAMPWLVRLIENLSRSSAEACTGVLSVLEAGGTPVAAHFGLANRRMLAHMFPTYDTAYKKYSPGLILNLRLAEAAAAAGLREISLGRGDFDYKQWFKSYDIPLGEGRVSRPAVGAAARWIRREPVRRLTGFVVSTPPLRRAADHTLKGLARARAALRVRATLGS